MPRRILDLCCFLLLLSCLVLSPSAPAQGLFQEQAAVPEEVERLYSRGLDYLASQQTPEGSFQCQSYNQVGVTALALLSFYAHGEDANFGPRSAMMRKGLLWLIAQQQESGMLGESMYTHGFATLLLAEAYGQTLLPEIGPALKKAVTLLTSSQLSNVYGAWRYGPGDTNSADTTVAGCCMMALLAARNAGIAIPDVNINKGLDYYTTCLCGDGGIGYTGADSGNVVRTAIASLVYAVGKRRDHQLYIDVNKYLAEAIKAGNTSGADSHGGAGYQNYYLAQALFQADMRLWRVWTQANTQDLVQIQTRDGAFQRNGEPALNTAFSLLSLALNYRFLPVYER